jgi:hypothetical protein
MLLPAVFRLLPAAWLVYVAVYDWRTWTVPWWTTWPVIVAACLGHAICGAWVPIVLLALYYLWDTTVGDLKRLLRRPVSDPERDDRRWLVPDVVAYGLGRDGSLCQQIGPVVAETPDDAGPPEDKPKGGFQRRIKELADERNYWREMAIRSNQPTPAPAPEPPKPTEPEPLPTLEAFGYDEAKYQAALLSHATKQAEAAVERRIGEIERQREERTRLSSFEERQREVAKANPEYEDLVLRDPTLPISAAMRDVIVDSPTGPEIALYLARNREQAEQIARLPVHLAALEMGRIEGRLAAIKEAKARPSAPAVSKAPPPPPTVEAAEADVTTPKASDPESDNLPMDQWLKARNRQLRKNAPPWARK